MTLLLQELDNAIAVLKALRNDTAMHRTVEAIAEACVRAILDGGKVMFCGNGGSAADSQHLAAELVGKLMFPRPGLAGLALTTDTSALTAIGNDFGFDEVFARQVEALGRKGDVLIGITTSGRSPNVLRALEAARERDIATVGFTGGSGGEVAARCDHSIIIPSSETQTIQEGHIVIGHAVCAMIEARIHGR